MRKLILSFLMVLGMLSLNAQKQITREAYLRFYSSTSVEDIEAITNKASSVIDLETGEFVCQVLMKSFHFEKALMEEHFNENYVESEKYPKAVFKGKIEEYESFDLSKDQKFKKKLKGLLLIHGVEKEVEVECTFTIAKGKVTQESLFYIAPKDYKIEIPSAVGDKISTKIEVSFKANYSPLK